MLEATLLATPQVGSVGRQLGSSVAPGAKNACAASGTPKETNSKAAERRENELRRIFINTLSIGQKNRIYCLSPLTGDYYGVMVEGVDVEVGTVERVL